MKVFIGYDSRQPVAAQVLAHSIWKRAHKPVDIVRLDIRQLPIQRKGLTEFTYSRYLVPYMCGYQGEALFLDADMLCLDDITLLSADVERDLDIFAPPGYSTARYPVSVVKSGEQFEWPSLMYFNNAKCRELTPDFIETGSPQKWVFQNAGELPKDWNHVVPYDGTNPNARIVHFTQGIPCFSETKGAEYGEKWREEAREAMSTVTWEEIMGQSVHKARMSAPTADSVAA